MDESTLIKLTTLATDFSISLSNIVPFGRSILNCFMRKSLTTCKPQPNLIGNNGLKHPNNVIQDNLPLYHWATED